MTTDAETYLAAPNIVTHDTLGDLFDQLLLTKFDDGEEHDDDANLWVSDSELERLAQRSALGDDATWNGVTGAMMRDSCAFFASEVLQGPPQAPYNGRFLISEHHEAWDQLIADHDRVCVLASRDHGKTFFYDFAFPIWKACFLPNGKGYIFSATQDQAVRILEDIKEEIESNPKLQWLVPQKKEQWSKTSIKLSNGHKIYARGYGTKIRGAHPNWIVVDDGLNDEDAYSELVRQKHIDYFYTAITNMIIPGGQIIVVGTPFHAADLYADLSNNPKYCFRRFPALDGEGNALWPERYCATDAEQEAFAAHGVVVSSLESKQAEIGSVRFTREFLCEPISDDMSLFPGRLFQGEPVEQFQVILGQPASYWDELGVTQRFIGVDFAMSTSTSADYTVVFVLGMDANQNRWVIDILRAKGLGYQQQLGLIKGAAIKYDPDLIFLESNQMQRIFGDELIRTTDLPIHKFVTTGRGKYNPHEKPKGNTTATNKNTLEGGVPSLRVLLENGKVRIPRGDARSIQVTDQWINEMKMFTWLEGKLQGVGAHDDTVMAFWIADQACRRGGFKFSTGDEEDYAKVDVQTLIDDQTEDVDTTPQLDRDSLDPAIRALLDTADEGEPKASGSLVDDEWLGHEGGNGADPIVAAAWAQLPGLKR